MKLGLFLLAGQFPGMTEGDALAGVVDSAVTAEQAGLDSVWLAEHHFITYGVCPSAVALAANVVGRTSRITVGTGVCMLSNRHPTPWARGLASPYVALVVGKRGSTRIGHLYSSYCQSSADGVTHGDADDGPALGGTFGSASLKDCHTSAIRAPRRTPR